jgi:hypothetical protein
LKQRNKGLAAFSMIDGKDQLRGYNQKDLSQFRIIYHHHDHIKPISLNIFNLLLRQTFKDADTIMKHVCIHPLSAPIGIAGHRWNLLRYNLQPTPELGKWGRGYPFSDQGGNEEEAGYDRAAN